MKLGNFVLVLITAALLAGPALAQETPQAMVKTYDTLADIILAPEIEIVEGLAAFDVDHYRVAVNELALEDANRQRVLHLALKSSLQRPRSVDRIESLPRDHLSSRVGQLDVHLPLPQELPQSLELDVDDLADVLATQRMEHDEVVDSIYEFGAEVAADDIHDGVLHRIIVLLTGHFLDQLRAEIRRHDDHGVAKIDGPSLPVEIGRASCRERV